MPNHCNCDLELEDTEANIALIQSWLNTDATSGRLGEIEFDKIIPMPADLLSLDDELDCDVCLWMVMSKHGTREVSPKKFGLYAEYPGALENTERNGKFILDSPGTNIIGMYIQGIAMLRFHAKYGATNWKTWREANWGVRYTGYDTQELGNIVQFDTAWVYPLELIKTMVSSYGLTGTFIACESGNFIACKIVFKDGEIISLDETNEDSALFRECYEHTSGEEYNPDGWE